jgi:hypothetical protein
MILPFVSESLKFSRSQVASKTIRSNRNPQMPKRGGHNVAGDLNFELAPEYGRLLKHIFGSYGVTGAAAPYTHTFKIGSLPVGMLIEKQFTDLTVAKYFIYNGIRVNSFKLAAKPEGMIDCSVGLIGAKETIGTTAYDSTVTDLGFSPFDGFEASITQGGAALGIGTSIDFTLTNGLDDKSFVIGGAGERHSLPAGTSAVNGSVEVLFESDTLYALAVADTETTLVLEFGRGDKSGTHAGDECFTFYFDELKFSPESPVVTGPTGLLVKLGFTAFYNDGANASACRAILLSPTATY